MRVRRRVMTENEKRFKTILTKYITAINEEHELMKKRGATYAVKPVYGNKYLSEKNYINIQGLHKFARVNPNLSSGFIEKLVKATASSFPFLDKFVTIVPEAVEGLREYGCDYMAEIYIQQLKAEKVVESVQKGLK